MKTNKYVCWIIIVCVFSFSFFILYRFFLDPQWEKINENTSCNWIEFDTQQLNHIAYKDSVNSIWYRFDTKPTERECADGLPYPPLRFKINPESFPDGCEIAWYTKRHIPLFHVDSKTNTVLEYKPNSIPRFKIFVYRISPKTLMEGCYFELPASTHSESLFLMAKNKVIDADNFVVDQKVGLKAFFSAHPDGRLLLVSIMIMLVLSFAYIVKFYSESFKKSAGLFAIVISFLMSAIWCDSSEYAGRFLVDAGDDSYYLAYTQNLIQYGDFFREPTQIAFGRRLVPNNHGMPGVSIMLSPPSIIRALCVNSIGERFSLQKIDIALMRGLSASYALEAMIFLFLTLHRIRPSVWSVLLPVMLLWCTSLPKWAFIRSIFTHSPEMFLLCLALFLATKQIQTIRDFRLVALPIVLGLLILLRGEYIFISFLLLFLYPLSFKCAIKKNKIILIRFLQLIILSIAVLIYYDWVGNIPTGYGTVSSAKLPIERGVLSILFRFIDNANILILSYIKNGGLLIIASISWIIVALSQKLNVKIQCPISNNDNSIVPPIRLWCLAVISIVMFLLNCAFTPPLGMEFQHRYSIKLYPMALLWLWYLLNGFVNISKRLHNVLKFVLLPLLIISVCTNFACLSDTNKIGANWQNYCFFSNIQLCSLIPSSYALSNMLWTTLWVLIFLTIFIIFNLKFLFSKKNYK